MGAAGNQKQSQGDQNHSAADQHIGCDRLKLTTLIHDYGPADHGKDGLKQAQKGCIHRICPGQPGYVRNKAYCCSNHTGKEEHDDGVGTPGYGAWLDQPYRNAEYRAEKNLQRT